MSTNTTIVDCDNLPAIRKDLKFSIYLYIFVYGPITLFGICLNIATIVAFRKLRNSVYYAVEMVAMFDLLFSVAAFTIYPLRSIYIHIVLGDLVFRINDWHFGQEIITVILPFFNVFQMARNWSVVVVSLERLLVVLFPLKIKTAWKKSTMNAICASYTIMSIATNWKYFFPLRIPGLWKWPCLKPGQFAFTSLLDREYVIEPPYNYEFPMHLEYQLFIFGTVGLPFLILLTINVCLVISVFVARKKRKLLTSVKDTSNKKAGQEGQVLKMVIAIVVIYFMCESPGCFDRLFFFLFNDIIPFYAQMIVRKVALAFSVLNSSLNFFAYCLTNAKFKMTVKAMIRRNP
ncbi:uncharacterized protein LOC141909195 [Tubulanus polymorphus]|uniref:uncharacterized protein LOC141909195 n=1 Tax=Tubulanus polymorphus TaxID=672921 RepID=UPI003DA3B580